jgi:hemoglobin
MLCGAAGGPQKYTGKDMKNSHRHLHIRPGEWDAFMDDVAQTLDKFAVPPGERAEVVAIVESTRVDIVV